MLYGVGWCGGGRGRSVTYTVDTNTYFVSQAAPKRYSTDLSSYNQLR